MLVLILAAIGVAIVLVSILILKLHPLLALLIGSLFLLVATPPAILRDNRLKDQVVTVASVLPSGEVGIAGGVAPGDYLVREQGVALENSKVVGLTQAASSAAWQVSGSDGDTSESSGSGTLVWYSVSDAASITKGTQIIARADFVEASQGRLSGLGGRLADGFTKTFRKLGIPVTMAAIVGICLLESGAAARLVAAIMSLFGPRGTAPALTVSGFVLGVPVFFDNVFYLLLPLAKAVGRQRPERFLTAVMGIIVGASMAHSLVPPTPGPLFVAEQIGVSVGMMMIGGLIVGGSAAAAGFAYGSLCHRWVKLSPDRVVEGEVTAVEANLKMPLWLAALPIAVPIALLGGSEIVEVLAKGREGSAATLEQWSSLSQWVALFNDPSLIFIGAAVAAIAILRSYSTSAVVGKSVAKGISDAGTIVLLTSAGGAFGASLQQLQIADAIGNQFGGLMSPWGLLFTSFFLTTIIRGAQGSATVAMLTSSAIVAPTLQSVELPFHPLYIALAIGCGSKPLPWMNDSGFWQVSTMTGMTTGQTLRTFSVALTVMGVTGFLVTIVGAFVLPLV